MSAPPAPDRPRRERVGAWFLLAGYVILITGVLWDGQWHNDVGPDTFFTAPHLFLYAGTATIGLTSLAVVLLTTWREPQQRAVTVLRVFRAPLPFLVAGVGASLNLLYAAADLWWHDVYGFDIAVANTPSHTGLGFAMAVELTGMVMAFAGPAPRRSQRWGIAAAAAVAMGGALPLANLLSNLAEAVLPGFGWFAFLVGAVAALLIGVVVGIAPQPLWPISTGLLFAAWYVALLLFTPAATRWYADLIDMPMRDYASGTSPAVVMPITFLGAALLAAGVVGYARRSGVAPRAAVPVLGALVAVVTALLYVVLQYEGAPGAAVTVLATAAVGAATGTYGWHLGRLADASRVRPVLVGSTP